MTKAIKFYKNFDDAVDNLKLEATSDYLGMWELLDVAERDLELTDPAAIKKVALDLSARLIESDIWPGTLKIDTGFHRWPGTAEEVLARIDRDWPTGDVPDMGTWFQLQKPEKEKL